MASDRGWVGNARGVSQSGNRKRFSCNHTSTWPCNKRPVIDMIRSRCAVREVALASCSPRLAISRQLERSPGRSFARMLALPLRQRQDIFSTRGFVVDFVHQLVHQVDPKSPDLSLGKICLHVRLADFGNIEGYSLIIERDDQPVL